MKGCASVRPVAAPSMVRPPAPVVDTLYRAIAAMLRQPEVQKQMLELGAEPVANTPDAFARQIAAEVEKWKKVVAATGVKVE